MTRLPPGIQFLLLYAGFQIAALAGIVVGAIILRGICAVLGWQ